MPFRSTCKRRFIQLSKSPGNGSIADKPRVGPFDYLSPLYLNSELWIIDNEKFSEHLQGQDRCPTVVEWRPVSTIVKIESDSEYRDDLTLPSWNYFTELSSQSTDKRVELVRSNFICEHCGKGTMSAPQIVAQPKTMKTTTGPFFQFKPLDKQGKSDTSRGVDLTGNDQLLAQLNLRLLFKRFVPPSHPPEPPNPFIIP
jgi:hypothetical protein